MLMPAGNAGCVLHETPGVPPLPEPPLPEPPLPEPPLPEPPPLLDELAIGKGGLKIVSFFGHPDPGSDPA
jgi:hypothetical protein